MPKTPIEIMEAAYQQAEGRKIEKLLSQLPDDCAQDLKIIVENAETQKAVLGVTLTSIMYKIFEPSQDVRNHQESMKNGYSGRTFDTKYVTPFLKSKFPHFAMAESAWLTRSLEQPHPFNFDFPGKIRNQVLKSAFLNTLNRIQSNSNLAPKMLTTLMGLMLVESAKDELFFTGTEVASGVTIAKIVEAVEKHIQHPYGKGVVGTARIPVVAIYSVYNLLMRDVRKYEGRTLASLEAHTSPDSRSKSLGDIDVNNADGTCFESVEVKFDKPITPDMIGVAYRKIKGTATKRYYILTTHDPNFIDYELVKQEVERYSKIHACEIVVNGVIPSLKYYLRLIGNPPSFIDEYTKWLEFEYKRASGIKREHLRVWQEIRQRMLDTE